VDVDIAAWLRGLGLERYAETFRAHHIDADVLAELSEDDLKELGVEALGDRKRLLRAVAALPPRGGPAAVLPPFPSGAERRQLTVMFVDLVGSTALTARLDPEEMSELLRRYRDAVVGALARFEGHVAKFMGDGVLAYFGWPKAHEDEAERAVRAGLKVCAAVAALQGPDGQPLAVRVGIATGLVVVGELLGAGTAQERAVIGETPNLAARLQAEARPHEVVIAETTRRLVGGLFALEEAPPVALKGFSEPVRAFRVLGEGTAEGRFEALHEAGMTPLVGRAHELGLLLERWQQARRGDGQVVLVAGEPGIGKSRLVGALRERLAGESHLPLSQYCLPFHQTSALYPIIALLERAARFGHDDGPAEKLDKLEALLSRGREDTATIVPLIAALLSIPTEGRYALPALSPQRQKELTLAALLDELASLAREQPVLVVYEDVHWADPTTLELLDLVIDCAPELSALVVVTFRPELTPPWRGRRHVTLLTLDRLPSEQGAALVGQVAGKALPKPVLQEILTHADGVPLFIEELTKAVLESGLLTGDDNGSASWPLPRGVIPASLQDLLLARLDRGTLVKEVAQIGACIGREFPHELLAAVSSLPEPELEAALARLIETELLLRRGTPPEAVYSFKHGLVRDAAYRSLLRSRRQQLHARIARAIEQRLPESASTEPELLAQHFTEAGLPEQALAYWRRAGERALERSAHAEAVSHLRRGLRVARFLPGGIAAVEGELRLQLALGSALMATKGYAAPEVEAAFLRARALCQEMGPTPPLFPVLHGLYRFYHVKGELVTAREIGEQLLDLARQGDDPACFAEAHQALGVSLLWLGEVDRACSELEAGIACYDRALHRGHAHVYGIDPGVVCLGYAGLAWWYLGRPERALERSRQVMALADKLAHPQSRSFAMVWGAWVRQLRGEPGPAGRIATQAVGFCAEQGFPLWLAMARILAGWAEAEAGDPASGIAGMEQGLAELRATGAGLWQPCFLALLAEAHGRIGRIGDGLRLLDEATAIMDRQDECFFAPELHRLRGELLLRHQEGQAEAEVAFAHALELAQRRRGRALKLRAGLSLARLRAEQGQPGRARALLTPIVKGFTEGADTPELVRARGFLASLP
jgi:class 3 adenylate cyclase/predicted ATPase